MRHPILRVKKGQETYNDNVAHKPVLPEAEERTGEPREVPRRRGAFLRMRRGSLLPLVILVVVAVFLLRVMPRSASRANIAGWHAVLQARVLVTDLDVGVAFSPLRPTIDARAPQAVSVVFVLPNTGQSTEVFGVLSGPRVALRSRMRHDNSDSMLRAVVTISGESRTLSLSLNNPVASP